MSGSSPGDPCGPCNGSGTVDDVDPATGKVKSKKCDSCGGSGRV